MMQKRLSFWIPIAITLSVWLSIVWIVQAGQGSDPLPREVSQPLQQACNRGPDLRIREIVIDSRGVGQPYDVRVEIINDSTVTDGLVDSWAYLYVDRTPADPPDVQSFATTARLVDPNVGSISANFTVTGGNATVGWHTVSVRIDATDLVPEACNGEDNNTGALSFEITEVVPPTPTATQPPTPQPPVIHFFTPEEAEVARGDSITLQWQVGGNAVSVYLDDVLMPAAHSYQIQPTEGHVYTLRAENPGGSVQASSRIRVVDPTPTPTATETPCNYPTIHEFGSSPTSVNRGEKVTIFWDVADATAVYLNGEGVSGVSAKTVTLKQTTVFTLVARNACGEIEETLTVQATYATPTATFTPTVTRTPTRTSTPTYTPPVPTPTRNVLPTHTFTPVPTVTPTSGVAGTRTTTTVTATTVQATGSPTATPTLTLPAFDSPIGTPFRTPIPPTASATATVVVATQTATLTPVPTSTWTPSPTPTVIQGVSPVGTVVALNPTVTLAPTLGPVEPTITPTPIPPVGAMRMYLCPLAVLLVFAIGVLVLSIVVPRLQARGEHGQDLDYATSAYGVDSGDGQEHGSEPEGYVPASGEAVFGPEEPRLGEDQVPEELSFDPLLDELISSERAEPE